MTAPPPDDPDEDRDVSDVGLPHPGDDAAPEEPSEAALDEIFPPEDR